MVLVTAYGLSVTLSAPSLPALRGLILFVLIAAWIWVPGLDRRGRRVAVALLAVAGLAAVPFAARLDAAGPWLDYSNWDWGSTPLEEAESFDWNHTYGPLDWTRDGRSLLVVGSKAPHYWSTEILDDFDGYRWAASPNGPGVDLPLRPGWAGAARPHWLVEARFEVHALSSQLLPGTGTVLSVAGLHGAERTRAGVSMPTAIGNRDAYTVRAYDPDPSPRQMRASEGLYPSALSGYTTIAIPAVSRVSAPAAAERGGEPKAVTIRSLAVPLRGTLGSAAVAADLGHSPYARVYRLARQIAAGQSTAYGGATAMQRYLRSEYRYSETPPNRAYPLAAFLFRDRIGYCQQFSGAMALMLRMVGIPSRVVGGFAPGQRTQGGFQVSDFDAHSWVEVYFNGIGWVTFDPTPPAAPAVSRSGGLFTRGQRQRTRQIASGSKPVHVAIPNGQPGQHAGGSQPLWPLLGLVAAILVAAPVVFLRRMRRRRPGSPAELAEAQAIELQDAVGRLRMPLAAGTTLRALERRLRGNGGPRAAAYAPPACGSAAMTPVPRSRRAQPSAGARRALSAGLGLRGRLRGWLAMPPGGPAPRPDLGRPSGNAGGEADRPDRERTAAGPDREPVRLVARVRRKLVEAGTLDRDRHAVGPVEGGDDLAPALDRRERAAGLIVELEPPSPSPILTGASWPPGNSSAVGGITAASGASLARSGAIGSGSSRRASTSRSSSWIASSVAAYSPSPKWYQRSAPPRPQRKRLGQPSQP